MNIGIQHSNFDDLPQELKEGKYILDGNLLFTSEKTIKESVIYNIKPINFFIGANNSGKSRFLRGIFKTQKEILNFFTGKESINEQFSQLSSFKNTLLSNLQRQSERSLFEEFLRNYNLENNVEKFKNNKPKDIDLEIISTLKRVFERIDRNSAIKGSTETFDKFISILKNILKDREFTVKNKVSNRKYIPVLRYANTNNHLTEISYSETIKDNYSIDSHVFTGLELYKELRDLQGQTYKVRKNKEEFENFLSRNFFDSKNVVLTPSNNGKKILLLVDEEERNLYDLGDGLQALLILMFPVFTASKNDWIFIDEPENHLHPGFQKVFLRTILNDKFLLKKNLKYFFTTHSNHFLDFSLTTDQISIFQFEKIEDSFLIKNLNKLTRENLDIIGVSNTSVLISNSSIWVEGPTDRKYISKWLYTYAESIDKSPLIEDIDFAFFEYGGSLISHYLFDDEFESKESEEAVKKTINSFALSNKIYLLVDNDNVDSRTKKGKRQKEFEKIDKSSFKYITVR